MISFRRRSISPHLRCHQNNDPATLHKGWNATPHSNAPQWPNTPLLIHSKRSFALTQLTKRWSMRNCARWVRLRAAIVTTSPSDLHHWVLESDDMLFLHMNENHTRYYRKSKVGAIQIYLVYVAKKAPSTHSSFRWAKVIRALFDQAIVCASICALGAAFECSDLEFCEMKVFF